MEENVEKYKSQIRELELKISELKFELEDSKALIEEEKTKHLYYQLIADFTFGWELWFEPDGNIKYCSPSCFDLTGFTSNQILNSNGISDLLVYDADRQKYSEFINR